MPEPAGPARFFYRQTLDARASPLAVCLGKYLGLCFHVLGSRLGYCAIKTMHPSVVSILAQTQLGHGSESHDTMKVETLCRHVPTFIYDP